jgi:hypothetical protein
MSDQPLWDDLAEEPPAEEVEGAHLDVPTDLLELHVLLEQEGIPLEEFVKAFEVVKGDGE